MTQPIHGLLLVGGESRRMGQDKAMLRYDGTQTQMERMVALLQSVCPKVFLSQRNTQTRPTPPGIAVIDDSVDEAQGPLCGILSAMAAHPEAHWLVVACDLPFLTKATLEKLLHAFRTTSPELVAYQSTHDQLPEPLCAIYPSGSDQELLRLARQSGRSCPRKLLIEMGARLITQDDPRSLDNINTLEEFEAIVSPAVRSSPPIHPGHSLMDIRILYFAQLAELAGKSEETRSIEDPSPAALYAQLQKEHGFPHDFATMQVAINHQLSAHETPLKQGDQIAFLPPMTGG